MSELPKNGFCDDADLQNCDFSGVIREGLCCMGARFDGSSFRGADLYWATAMDASFRNCDLTEACFRGADLKEVDFRGAIMTRTNFGADNLNGFTDLSGADLSTAVIRDCCFDGARYDVNTRFPQGFYPEKHGLVLVERRSG